MIRQLILALVVAGAFVLAACSSEQGFAESPYASVLPGCPVGYREHDASFRAPPGGSYYVEHRAISETQRICDDDDFRLWLRITVFEDAHAAQDALQDSQRFGRATNGWSPGRPVDDFFRAEIREDDCFGDDERRCSVSDHIEVQSGATLLLVSGEDRGAEFSLAAYQLGLSGVIGDARWSSNERLMDRMLASFRVR